MVASVPMTPDPAVTGPLTGGQIWAQDPLQFDLAEVSGANEYTAKPVALVSTVAPLIVAAFSELPDDEPVAVGAADVEVPDAPEVDDELLHAATASPAATTAASASQRIRCRCPKVVLFGSCIALLLYRFRFTRCGRDAAGCECSCNE